MQNQKALRWAINLAALIVLMDLSAVNIAMPAMRAFFRVDVPTVSLVLMISMLTASSSALIMGKLSQLFSPKRILIVGFIAFGTTTFLSSFCQRLEPLLALRFLQGFAESALYVIGPALIKRYLPKEEQAKAYGQWMMSTGIGISLGPLVGGYLLDWFSWSAVFLINVPLTLLGLWFSLKLSKTAVPKATESFDWWGALFSFLFLASLIAAVNVVRNPALAWLNSPLLFAFSALFLMLFLFREKRSPAPVLQLSLFRKQNFWLASLGFFLFFVINVGSRFMRPFYFEEGRGFGPEISGWLMVISPALMVLLSPLTRIFQQWWGTKQVVMLGNIFLFLSMVMFSFWGTESSLFHLISTMVLLGIGMGFYYPATTTIGMEALSLENYGMGSAVISTAKSLGKLVGVLLFAVLFSFFLNPASENDTITTNLKIASMHQVFIVATVLAFIALLFSFFFKPSNTE